MVRREPRSKPVTNPSYAVVKDAGCSNPWVVGCGCEGANSRNCCNYVTTGYSYVRTGTRVASYHGYHQNWNMFYFE